MSNTNLTINPNPNLEVFFRILGSFWNPFWSKFDPGGYLGGSLGPSRDTLDPQVAKNTKKTLFRPHFLIPIFTIFSLFLHTFFKKVLRRTPDHFLMDFRFILKRFLTYFPQLFEGVGNLGKCNPSNAKPLFLNIWGHVVHDLFIHFSKQFLEPVFYHFLIDL